MSDMLGSWQFTAALVIATLVFGGGSVATLALGHTVPDALWAIDGSLASALLANNGFFTLRTAHQSAIELAHAIAVPNGGKQ